MKKTTFIIIALAVFCRILPAFEFTGLSSGAEWFYNETGQKNILAWNALELEKKHGINVHVFRFTAGTSIEPERLALAHYNTLTRTAGDRMILLWLGEKREQAVILADAETTAAIGAENIAVLQASVLQELYKRWYISTERVAGKILGTIAHILDGAPEKSTREKGAYIDIQNALFRISLAQPFSDLVKLFHFEPLSFFFYFPFVMYALIVRLAGLSFGKGTFIFLNILWAACTGFVFVLIINRIVIFVPEYTGLFSVFMGMNFPLYIMLFTLYRDRIESAAYNYLHDITGGFGTGGGFGGIK